MAAPWRAAAESLVRDLDRIFNGRLRSVVAYGPCIDGDTGAPVTCLALVDTLTLDDLEQCAACTARWTKQRIATPLILPETEFTSSLDAFPLEYGEILRAHELVHGSRDPLSGAAIRYEDLRRACETQIKGHLLHLREGFIESGGRPGAVASLVANSAPAFAALLRNVARLSGAQRHDRHTATLEGARAAGLPERIVGDVLALEQNEQVPTADAARLFPEYLAAVEQLAARIDRWGV